MGFDDWWRIPYTLDMAVDGAGNTVVINTTASPSEHFGSSNPGLVITRLFPDGSPNTAFDTGEFPIPDRQLLHSVELWGEDWRWWIPIPADIAQDRIAVAYVEMEFDPDKGYRVITEGNVPIRVVNFDLDGVHLGDLGSAGITPGSSEFRFVGGDYGPVTTGIRVMADGGTRLWWPADGDLNTAVMHFDSPGALDTSFGASGLLEPASPLSAESERLMVFTREEVQSPTSWQTHTELCDAAGELLETSPAHDEPTATFLITADDRIYNRINGDSGPSIERLLPDLSRDPTFGSSGRVPVSAVWTEGDNRERVWLWNTLGGAPSQLLSANPVVPPEFSDDDGSVFEAYIEWLAQSGITKGCNPPVNDMFRPDDSVTRGQMAAFLHRALDDAVEPTGDPIEFVDDDDSLFAADIAWLSATGITKGCGTDTFCPDDPVTRGQMAAFLVRALGYSDDGDGDLFTDDDDSIFEDQIDKLATASVTKGCNPPTNDEFCPNSHVTRGQMAAFLRRALG